jgi:hypothetical protein
VLSVSLNKLKLRNSAFFERIIFSIIYQKMGRKCKRKALSFPTLTGRDTPKRPSGSYSCRFHFHVRGPDSSIRQLQAFPELSARDLWNVVSLQ